MDGDGIPLAFSLFPGNQNEQTTLKEMNFADIKSQGYMPLYSREKITDDLHDVCGFRTDYEFISKSKMKTIQKNSKGRK